MSLTKTSSNAGLVLLFAGAIAVSAPAAAYAQDSCTGGSDLFDWRTAGPPGPPPLEKTVADLPAPARPAVPADISKAPYKYVGKFLSSVNGEKRYCTAQFVGSTDVLLTAAHCVRHKNGTWLDRFEFMPAASPGGAIKEALCIATLSNWASGAASNWFYPADFAFILLKAPASSGFLKLEPATTSSTATTIGYPLQIQGGAILHRTDGQLRREPTAFALSPGEDFGVVEHGESRFGLGISGGAWIVDPSEDESGGGNRVVGVNATVGDAGVAAGPVLADCASKLLAFLRANCPK